MSNTGYTFAVARIRAMETGLFSGAVIDQLMSAKTYEEALRFLSEKGWGDGSPSQNVDAMLSEERAKIWQTVEDLRVPMETFDVLSLPNVFHNLKTAIKEAYLGVQHDDFFYANTAPSREELREIIKNKDYGRLPGSMEEAAKEAFETLLHTRDGQLCDMIIDRACLNAVRRAGEEAADEVIRTYAEITVAVADIKIAVRCQKTQKPYDFILRALAPCKGMQAEALAKAATADMDTLCEYFTSSGYGEAAEAIKVSPSAFECWCDNYMIEMLQPQKYEAFSVGPLVAYIIARENEIKTVGIILSGKRNSLADENIRERIREMYV